MRTGTARILQTNDEALRVVASSARISTQQGTALEIYDRSGDREKDLKLIGKVLSSGHKSVIEHQTFGVAFDDVSVLVEQFVIEFRLASFTVKSRRYVDFSGAGCVVPDGMSPEVREIYKGRVASLFRLYERLLMLEIPREDARFVLPYGFRSNFYMTVNARELIHMIAAMTAGRGSAWPEIRMLGEQLREQFDALYPGAVDAELKHISAERPERCGESISAGEAVKPAVRIVSAPTQPMALLKDTLRFSNRFDGADLNALLNDARPRELEVLNYTFHIDNVSLAAVTHFTRHRMLSLMLRHELSALSAGNYVLPETIASNSTARELYESAFADQAAAAARARELGAADVELDYFAMAGHTTSILISMNARELLHFSKLRSCSRAQWEIRGIARTMIAELNATDARPIFQHYGPTCAVTGRCPEGRMTCGHPVRIEDGVWKVQE